MQQIIVPNLQEACIDEQRIVQVLTNLLGNAAKFTPEGGDVVVRVEDDPERTACLLVAVSDTGRGIAPEQCGHIFDRLYQVR
ncbi:MAG: ATP-binding protein, partial [bacterium]|nr:ATP-binding protein [bacterium]